MSIEGWNSAKVRQSWYTFVAMKDLKFLANFDLVFAFENDTSSSVWDQS